jgi:hypothetical protein
LNIVFPLGGCFYYSECFELNFSYFLNINGEVVKKKSLNMARMVRQHVISGSNSRDCFFFFFPIKYILISIISPTSCPNLLCHSIHSLYLTSPLFCFFILQRLAAQSVRVGSLFRYCGGLVAWHWLEECYIGFLFHDHWYDVMIPPTFASYQSV